MKAGKVKDIIGKAQALALALDNAIKVQHMSMKGLGC